MSFRHVTPVPPRSATGLVAEVYRQQAADTGLPRMPALMVLSPVPELLAATWSLLREALMAGPVPRTDRELVALGVSLANRCPFCVNAHAMFLHATGDHRLAEAVLRGERPADPRQARLLDVALSPDDPPELAGTALAFHFINRMVSALHTDDVLPGGLQRSRAVRGLAGRMLSRAAARPLPPGESLRLLPVTPPSPAWAGRSPVGTAYAALVEIAERGAELVPQAAAVREEIAAWDGTHPPLGSPWPAEPVRRLALLAAKAPYRIGEADVAAAGLDEAGLVGVLAFGAVTATRRHEPRGIPA